MGVTFLHTGDLHLGSPLRALTDASADLGEELARATQASFRRVVEAALDRDVDFVVVAGDLYDREARSVRANEFLVDQFERLAEADIPCYVVHGNHDPLGDGAEQLSLPENTHVFGTEEVEHVSYPDEGRPEARILGQSYGSRHESNKLYYHYNPPDTSVPNIGLLHTGLNPDGRRYAPCGADDLASKDIDYWALGHIHDTGLVDGAPAAYCGIPQGRHIGEAGAGGCLIVDVEVGTAPDIEFVPTSPIVWHELTVDIGATSGEATATPCNLTDLEEYMADHALDLQEPTATELVQHDIPIAATDWEPEGFVCRWELTGRGEVHEVLADDGEATATLGDRLRSRLDGRSPLIWTEVVRDRTGPPIPDQETLVEADDVIAELLSMTEDLRADPSARSDFREQAGEIWTVIDDEDREDTPADRLPLTDDRLDELIDRSLAVAIERLAIQRNHVD